MKVHLFGLPLSTHRRLKEQSRNWHEAVPDPHAFRATPISTNEHTPFTEGELRDLAAAVSDGFVHIVVPASRDWKFIQAQFKFDCRIHVARLRQPIRDVSWPSLKEHLHAIAKLDAVWLETCCPKDLRHPLLLPPSLFETSDATREYWRRCDTYSEKTLSEAENLLKTVDQHHRLKDRNGGRSWIDARKRRYRIDPSNHGRSPTSRAGRKTYRFCYEVPPGFHYDVTDDEKKPFNFTVNGKTERVTHCNVTPWGQVRCS
jgi:hypothetical protein